jgi:hypothetical protein
MSKEPDSTSVKNLKLFLGSTKMPPEHIRHLRGTYSPITADQDHATKEYEGLRKITGERPTNNPAEPDACAGEADKSST